eukprot:TRINITY_DN9822_c1_g1_i1.p1 TRINITY_DN9822_c1_g1~~TRINITY_DN9822_c1_g1_i1.p1  ORF type:complete len:429 (+),score=98.32 TRINITY_DN9822_c1_g1_i1:31-1317(+)
MNEPGLGEGERDCDPLISTGEFENTVPLNIKSSTSAFQDLRFECPLTWTVANLKQNISLKLESKISPKKQRLVYAGKILDDADKLNDVIRFQDECPVYTILLVSSEPQKTTMTKSKPESELRRRKVDNTRPSSSTNNTASQPISQPAPLSGNLELNSWASEYLQMSNRLQGGEELPSQQMAAMQEMYSQYLMQYMQYIQTSSPQYMHMYPQSYLQGLQTDQDPDISRGSFTTTTTTLMPEGGSAASDQHPQQHARLGEGGLAEDHGVAAVHRGVDPAADIPPAAQGQQQQQEQQRDALDWVYSCVRILFLVSLVYFYSSFPRFLLVLGIFLAFQYFQREGNQQHQERLNIQEQVNNIRYNNNNPQQQANNATEDQNEDEQEINPEDNIEIVEEEREGEENPDIVTMVSTFIMSFFTSLLPEPNNQLID